MTPMEPVPETVEALEELDDLGGPDGLLARLVQLADHAQRIVPDLVGVSVARQQEGVAFTLVASAPEVAVLDAVQYVAGGPCVDAADSVDVREFTSGDVLDEERWQLFAEATAARAVRSTLTLPVVAGGEAVGTINMYAGSRRAFDGHHEQLADVFGAWAGGAVANADLSFSTRADAEATPGRVRDQVALDTAVGLLAARLGLEMEDAESRLDEAALRAGVDRVELARQIIRVSVDPDRSGGGSC